MPQSFSLRTSGLPDLFDMILDVVSDPQFQEVAMLFVFAGIFISSAKLFLPKRMTQGSAGKVLTASVGIGLTIGLYSVISLYNVSLASFGFLGNMMVILIFAFMFNRMLKGFEAEKSIAFSATYAVLFMSFLFIEPTLFDSIAGSGMPWLNGIATIIFVITLGHLIWHFVIKPFKGGRISRDSMHIADKTIKSLKAPSADETEAQEQIEDETKAQKSEQKHIKKDTLRLTDLEIKTVRDIGSNVNRMMQLLHERGDKLSAADADSITHVLQKINQDESILKRGLIEIQREAIAYENEHKKEIAEQRGRHAKTKNPKVLKFLTELEKYEAQMFQASKFVEQNEKKIINFARSFNQQIQAALMQIKDKKARSGYELPQLCETQPRRHETHL